MARKITYTFRTPFTSYADVKRLRATVYQNYVSCVVETETNERNVTVSVSGENLTDSDRQNLKMIIAKFVAQSTEASETLGTSSVKIDETLIGINKPNFKIERVGGCKI